MHVARVRIEGVLGFHGDRAVDLTLTRPDGSHAGWTVLAGRNGSGKTTLLRAIAVALCTPAQAYPLAPDLQTWQSAEPGRIDLTVRLDGSDRPTESGCRWTPTPGRPAARAQVAWSRTAGEADPAVADSAWEVLTETQLAGYGAFRRLAAEATAETSALASLFDDDAVLGEGVAWLVAEHHRSLERRPGAAERLAAVLEFLGDGLLPDGLTVLRVDSDGLWVAHEGRELALRSLSGGHRTAVALVLNLLRAVSAHHAELPVARQPDGRWAVTGSAVVLIDEVDAHLHVTWQQRIGQWLKAHFPRVQFIVTTHSPYICQAADPGGLIRLGAAGDGTAPEVVSDELYQRVVYGSGDDAILSELFGLESPYSAVAEQARRRIGDLEGDVLSGSASDAELAEYQELSRKLNSSLEARVDEVAARLARRA